MIKNHKDIVAYAERFSLTIKSKETPLVTQIKANNLSEVKKIANKNNVNTVTANKIHEVPLLLALVHGTDEMVETLLSAGANPNVTFNSVRNPAWLYEKSALTVAIEKGYRKETIAAMLNAGYDKATLSPKTYANNPLSAALAQEAFAVVDLILAAGARIDEKDHYGRTSLLVACLTDKPATVDYLLKNKANPNISPRADGMTPLMAASYAGNEKIVAALLKHKAKIELADVYGRRALNYAAQGKNKKAAELIQAVKKDNSRGK